MFSFCLWALKVARSSALNSVARLFVLFAALVGEMFLQISFFSGFGWCFGLKPPVEDYVTSLLP